MAHSLAQVILPVVFSTKKRVRSITDAIRPQLHASLAEVGRSMDCHVYRVGGITLSCSPGREMDPALWMKRPVGTQIKSCG